MRVRKNLVNAKRIVVKVGTSTITYPKTGKLNLNRLETLTRELADLANEGREIILVTSGAIAVGRSHMKRKKSSDIAERQVMAAVGQGLLMNAYEKLFAQYGVVVGQVLLTRENSLKHHQYINSRGALLAMLRFGVVPIINENDAVSIDELKIGDNDTLSAVVASLVDADVLILLSDVDGLYDSDPAKNPNAKFFDTVEELTPEIEGFAGPTQTQVGTGGMFTKLKAAKIAQNSGVSMIITQGDKPGLLRKILEGEQIGTLFPAKKSHLKVRKSWLAFGQNISGALLVDDGCVQAMQRGASLLPVGLISVEGTFDAKSTVRILSTQDKEIARGSVNYSSDILKILCRKNSAQVKQILLEKNFDEKEILDEVIHRDNLILMK